VWRDLVRHHSGGVCWNRPDAEMPTVRQEGGENSFMRDWNVVVTVREGAFVHACRYLEQFGTVRKSAFFNVLVMKADDPLGALEKVHGQITDIPEIPSWIARFVPVTRRFSFQNPEEFEERARDAVAEWLSVLAGGSFHLRMHRRGFKGRLSSMDEERFLDEYLLERLAGAGTPGAIAFDDPDWIIVVETVGTEAGLSIWGRDDLRRYPLLRLD